MPVTLLGVVAEILKSRATPMPAIAAPLPLSITGPSKLSGELAGLKLAGPLIVVVPAKLRTYPLPPVVANWLAVPPLIVRLLN